MALTPEQETGLLAMLAEWQAQKDQQAQSLLDQKLTAEGQLRGLQPVLSAEKSAEVDAALKTDTVAGDVIIKR